MKEKKKLVNSLISSLRGSFMWKIQKKAQITELPAARDTPVKLVCLNSVRSPWEETSNIPAKLITKAI